MGTQSEWSNRYAAKAYDRISFFVKKGQKETIQQYIAAMKEKYPDRAEYASMNSFVNFAISKTIAGSEDAD